MNIKLQKEDNLYHLFLTNSQVESIRNLNARASKPHVISQRCCDVIDFVEDNDPRADMITGMWFTMTIGILPDGSCHS